MRLYRRGKSKAWTLDVRHRGRRYVVSSRISNQKQANEWARDFIARLHRHEYRPNEDDVTFEQLVELARNDYIVNGRRSLYSLELVMRRLARAFSSMPALSITHERIERYKAERLKGGDAHAEVSGLNNARAAGLTRAGGSAKDPRKAAKATVNADLAALSLMFRLALEQGLVSRKPRIKFLNVQGNVRQGFVSQGDYLAIRAGLPERLADLTDFLWWTGLRVGTSRQLEWRDVYGDSAMELGGSGDISRGPQSNRVRVHRPTNDALDVQWVNTRHAWHAVRSSLLPRQGPVVGTVRIRSATTKTGEAHEIPLVGELAAIIARAASYRDLRCPYVFHRRGRQINKVWASIAWKKAARAAGLGHIIMHDLRRSFVRNMRLAGMPEDTIMGFTGHRTRGIFSRYNIVRVEEKAAALERMSEYLGGQSKESSVRKIK